MPGKFAAILFLIIASLPVRAQSIISGGTASFKVRGVVLDALDNKPLELATILLKDKGQAVIKTASTDAAGAFNLTVQEKGTYFLTISHTGYEPYSGTIDVKASTGDVIKFTLLRQSQQLRVIEVKKRKPLVQSKGDKLVYNAAADIGNKSGSAANVLRKAPMVTVSADGVVSLRGNSNIKILLNGIPSGILAKNLKEALKMIPASSILSIEVITAPSARYEAEGAAGVINIITKEKIKSTSGTVDISMGNREQSASIGLNMSGAKLDFSVMASGMFEQTQKENELNRASFYKGQPAGSLVQRADSRQRTKGASLEMGMEYRPDSTQKFGTTLSYWHDQWPVRSNLYNDYRDANNPSRYNQSSDQQGRFHYIDLSLNYQKRFKRKKQSLQLLGNLSRSTDRSSYQTDQFTIDGTHFFREVSPNSGRSKDYSFQADYTHPFNKAGNSFIEMGVRWSKNDATSNFAVYNNINNRGSKDLKQDQERSDSMTYFQDVFASYVSTELQTKNNWRFRLGARYEYTRINAAFKGTKPSFGANFSNLVPNLLIAKKVNEAHELKFSYTERIRRPFIWDLNPYIDASDPRNLTMGNPRLRPELTRMLEASHIYSAASGLNLVSSVYFNFNSNSIESLLTVDSNGISRTLPQNIAANKRLGANINAYTQLSDSWTINGGLELYQVWFKSNALQAGNSGFFHAFNINTSYTIPSGYTFELSGDYNNGFITLQGKSTSDYTYRIAVQKEVLQKRASITLSVVNPFQRNFRQRSMATAPAFNQQSTTYHYNRSVAIAFNWRFGKATKSKEEKMPEEQPTRPERRRTGRY
ncbi:TonB-dependent receptor [Chitinophaga polysaccharea]|uniref:TonB-dependent receptor domain-containing protein n=1 Tax=Chitinophaga polysaccharea TaxID=1293035 RepID=UPI00145533E2|nr:TonB-dependent receptor [Chitinophaga polysaccharea]NLR59254.1 TonB-dependent receptor [Chitinophaga polysaccharea]